MPDPDPKTVVWYSVTSTLGHCTVPVVEEGLAGIRVEGWDEADIREEWRLRYLERESGT